MGTITSVEMGLPFVALSFDDGPHAGYTPALLAVLKKHEALATFFMVGRAVREHPELVRQVYRAGHAIGNHTFSHTALPELKPWQEVQEILSCRRAIQPYGTRLLRPPWGKQTYVSRLVALLLGYKVIAWNLTAEDWIHHDSKWMADHLSAGLQPGCIILLHDRIFKSTLEDPRYDRAATVEAVDMLLERERGTYRFVTVPQLLKYGKPRRVMWM